MKAFFLLIFFLFSASFLQAEKHQDSISNYDETVLFSTKKIILPASLIATGALGLWSDNFQAFNRDIRNSLGNPQKDNHLSIDEYLRFLPVASNFGLDFIGVKAKHSFNDRLITTATSHLIMGAIVYSTKSIVNEKRPNSSEKNSFPSGHAATAFVGAELVRMEYGLGYGIGAYTVACSVAFFRLYNDEHWLNDVLAGAGIGILSAQIAYWLLPYCQKIFKIPHFSDTMVVPFYNPDRKEFGGSFAINF